MECIQPLFRVYRLIAALAALPVIASAAQLTISPDHVAIGYTGRIEMALSGLTTGSQVLVEKYVDFNNNGSVDAQELLVQSFRITDGQVALVAGARNRAVPGDDDLAVNGAIRASYQFPLQSELNRAAGRYVYRVTGAGLPAGGLLASFMVNQSAETARVEGQVRAAGQGVPFALVLLFQDGPPVYMAYANTLGYFQIKVPQGRYEVMAVSPTCLFNGGTTPTVTLSNSQVANVVMSDLVWASITVSGKITGAGAGLPGVQTVVKSEDGWISIGTTGADGTFTLGCRAAQQHEVEISPSSAAQFGFLAKEPEPTFTSGNVNYSGMNLYLDPVESLVHGRLVDELGQGLGGVALEIQDPNHENDVPTYTDASGYYSAGVGPGTWVIELDDDSGALDFWCRSQQTSVGSNQAVEVNLAARHFNAWISGQVEDETGRPQAFVQLGLYHLWDGQGHKAWTDANGRFCIGTYDNTNTFLACGRGDENTEYIQVWFIAYSIYTDGYGLKAGEHIRDARLVVRKATRLLQGVVKDSAGNPVVGLEGLDAATSVGHHFYTSGYNTKTDAQGRFQIPVFDGLWEIRTGYTPLLSRGFRQPYVSVEVSATRTNVTIVLSRTNEPNIYAYQAGFGDVGEPYTEPGFDGNYSLTVSGGTPPYTWMLASDSDPLPPGLTPRQPDWSQNTLLHEGTPTVAGRYQIRYVVTDSQGLTGQVNWGILIRPAGVVKQTDLELMKNPASGGYQLRLSGGAGSSQIIESSLDLTRWIHIQSLTRPSAPGTVTIPLEPGEERRFYRARFSD